MGTPDPLSIYALSSWEHAQSITRDFQRQDAPTGFADGRRHAAGASLLHQKNHTTSASGSADFPRQCAVLLGHGNQLVYQWRRDSGNIRAPQFPLLLQQSGDLGPISGKKGAMHFARDTGDAFEVPKYSLIAVNMSLEDFPIIDARLTR